MSRRWAEWPTSPCGVVSASRTFRLCHTLDAELPLLQVKYSSRKRKNNDEECHPNWRKQSQEDMDAMSNLVRPYDVRRNVEPPYRSIHHKHKCSHRRNQNRYSAGRWSEQAKSRHGSESERRGVLDSSSVSGPEGAPADLQPPAVVVSRRTPHQSDSPNVRRHAASAVAPPAPALAPAPAHAETVPMMVLVRPRRELGFRLESGPPPPAWPWQRRACLRTRWRTTRPMPTTRMAFGGAPA
mmetsp:Transcript_10297/g.31717  ORF Transcript_10297/g.31717 Transcript_10297/m.31717 type:complete len:240 (-) Transcript_10297:9-728(-)